MEIFLRWAGVTVFTLLSWRYLWNGRDEFSAKEWGMTLLKMVGLLAGFTLAMLILRGLHEIWPVIDRRLAVTIVVPLCMSLLAIQMNKILIAALHTIFARILQFHQVHNTAENYRKLSSSRYGSVSDRVWFIKWLLTLNVVLMLYGIWFGIHP